VQLSLTSVRVTFARSPTKVSGSGSRALGLILNTKELKINVMIYEEDLVNGSKVARVNNMNLSKFKKEINKGLLTTNNENQWTLDYGAYLLAISNGGYESPSDWGESFYDGRWSLD
jgi:hypothetical protein